MATYNKADDDVVVYSENPSVMDLQIIKKTRKTFLRNGDKALVIDNDGAVAGTLGAVFIEQKEVDTEQFIKLYAGGIDELADLSGAGFKLFKLVYKLMLEKPNSDIVVLDFNALKIEQRWKWARTTFISGVNELLSKKILFKHYATNNYFYNVKLFFNGDRISVVKQYRLKQTDMFDEQSLLD
ncbi:MAG: hypothetical protein RL273_1401 [Bacteroidota bacterium]|jgi:hypothetical protein